ncbi:hypothetical protein LGQ03_02245 [Loktanella sp. TSTF-M6]|uniref:YD repeat-containing protein n=1 Tax=Loktanella gaetbuli TaxID=2881335 RepID=A0ABS8BRD1_9RHOB|nr:hypothetical protein [Loktanella gaetbuli]MCB5198051.1 hypothetical protein [Loktanella gaetbuli]
MPTITTETRTDPDNLSNWNTIVITRTDGVETSRTTTYDVSSKPTSGLVITDDRDDIGLTRRLSVDAQNVNSWSSIEVIYDTSSGASLPVTKTTNFDNGQSVVDTYDASGTVVSTLRTDADPSQDDWSTISTTLDTETGRTTVLTQLDDGSSVQETTAADGTLIQRVRTDGTGDDNTSSYSTITTDYDSDGNVQQITYDYDNGLERVETYATTDGTTYMTGAVQSDLGDAYSWLSITETMNADGNVTSRAQVNDDGSSRTQTFDATGVMLSDEKTDADGVVQLDTYVAGVLTSTTLTDSSTDGAAEAWASKTVTFAGGEKTGDAIVYDNGTSVTKTYTEGVLSRHEFTDGADGTAADTRSYDSIVTTYAADGDRISSVTTMDNSDTISRTYNEDGSIAQYVRADVSDSKSFATITRDYDADGDLSATTLVKDDGVTSVNSFDTTTGLRTSSVVTDASGTDSTQSWSEVAKTYDAAGNLTQHQTTYDNGNVKSTSYTYTDGELTAVSTTQDGPASGTGIFVAELSKTYAEDSGGELYLSEVSKTLSNDKQVVQTYAEDGDIASRVTTDISADGTGFKWDMIEIQHDDAGRVDSKLTTYDTGDEILVLFDDANAKTARVQFDGNESNSWQFRVTEYDAEGNGTTSYATAADLDNAYRDFFDLAPIVV